MARQSITLTNPNNEWLIEQIESGEYSSKSELVNDLIRQARHQQAHVEWVRRKIDLAEKSGFSKRTRKELLDLAKNGLDEKI